MSEQRKPGPDRPSPARIALWIAIGGLGLYLIGSGLFGIIAKG